MTNKEFFLKWLDSETPVFVRVLKAIPSKNQNYKPDPKSKTAVEIAAVLVSEAANQAKVMKTGMVDFGKNWESAKPISGVKAATAFAKNAKAWRTAVAKASDKDWENKILIMKFPVGEWKAKMSEMSWGLLFDMVHHRGQISTHLRAMGGKVPSIYGPSADTKPSK